MTLVVIVAGFHYLAIMAMVSALVGEHLLLKSSLTIEQARSLRILDLLYGAAATVVLLTGIARVFLEKGPDYYLHHGAFHALLTLFIVTALLSIYPTVVFIRWRVPLAAGQLPTISADSFKRLKMIMRVEMLLVFLMPFFAAWMARGV